MDNSDPLLSIIVWYSIAMPLPLAMMPTMFNAMFKVLPNLRFERSNSTSIQTAIWMPFCSLSSIRCFVWFGWHVFSEFSSWCVTSLACNPCSVPWDKPAKSWDYSSCWSGSPCWPSRLWSTSAKRKSKIGPSSTHSGGDFSPSPQLATVIISPLSVFTKRKKNFRDTHKKNNLNFSSIFFFKKREGTRQMWCFSSSRRQHQHY